MAAILVVEDDLFMRGMLQAVLEANGYSVTLSSSGAEALARLACGVPDLVLLDLSLPDISGLEVLRLLHAAPGWGKVPIVMLTASHDLQHMVAVKAEGGRGYIAKPVKTETLLSAVSDILQQDGLIWLDDFTRSRRAG